jgi:hypothetical protein
VCIIVVSSGSLRLTGHSLPSADERPYAGIPSRPVRLGTEDFVTSVFGVVTARRRQQEVG